VTALHLLPLLRLLPTHLHRRAQALEPGYCEPAYWIALTAINSGDVLPGLAAMRESLSCKYTAAEALGALNRLYVMLHEGSPLDPRPMMVWACSGAGQCYWGGEGGHRTAASLV
jgi:hypothetical protein